MRFMITHLLVSSYGIKVLSNDDSLCCGYPPPALKFGAQPDKKQGPPANGGKTDGKGGQQTNNGEIVRGKEQPNPMTRPKN